MPRPLYELELDHGAGTERWLVGQHFGGAADAAFAADAAVRRAGLCALMPYAAAAARIDGGGATGRLYASLPTPVPTGLQGAMLDGRFELARDRNALCVDTSGGDADGRRGADVLRAEWNARLMGLAAEAYGPRVEINHQGQILCGATPRPRRGSSARGT